MALDVGIAHDTPGTEGDEKLGGGPLIVIYDATSIPNRRLLDLVFDPNSEVLAATMEFTITRALQEQFADEIQLDAVQLTTDDNRMRQTSTDGDTLMPYWNDTVSPVGGLSGTIIGSATNRWTISIIDQDNMVGGNESICSISPHPTPAQLIDGTVVLTGGSCTKVTLELNCNN